MREADNNSWSIFLSVVGAYAVRTSSLNDKYSCQFSEWVWGENHTHIDHTFNQGYVVATIFPSLAFLSSSISMANLSHLVAAVFSSLALLSSSISTANLSCLLATTFSSLRFLSNSLSSPHFNLLKVARRCFLWFSVFLFFPPSLKLCLL